MTANRGCRPRVAPPPKRPPPDRRNSQNASASRPSTTITNKKTLRPLCPSPNNVSITPPLLDIPVRAEDCVASVYAVGDSSQAGAKTASGIPLNDNATTAAHKSLPFGSKVKVTNKKNGHAVTVTITDRGPYVKGRCIDLSKAGARALGFA